MTNQREFLTAGGLRIRRQSEPVVATEARNAIADGLNTQRGVLLSSNYDYPGRYTRWDMGFVDPLLELMCRGREIALTALNERGQLLLAPLTPVLANAECAESFKATAERLSLRVRAPSQRFSEEERSRQPSVFSIIRLLVDFFRTPDEPYLGLYGAFGYDLTFQFEPIELHLERAADQRDLVLYLPDELLIVDHRKAEASRYRYDFEWQGKNTRSLSAQPWSLPTSRPPVRLEHGSDHKPGEYAASVGVARELFRQGELFELVLGQTFREPCTRTPSQIFAWLQEHNPAPYGLLINLGNHEHLVGASPEMYVRVEGRRVETCPISGTIARGADALEDAERIRELLNSEKDESELSMCTDVDRNDKSRICEPGSVKVLGRRQIELYSRLIHTVDHVEGTLRPEFDALDAFLSHTWAVTVTGAPKPAAIATIERVEKSPRRWYGGAVGVVRFDGTLNTGLTLRTVRLSAGQAEVRAGATLLYDSDPELEERETQVKASAFLDAVRGVMRQTAATTSQARPGTGRTVLLVDHEDSFVHTLANYLRQTGATVVTLRRTLALERFAALKPDLVVLSPGPGTPSSFGLSETIALSLKHQVPLFGVCLGLQGIAEYFGAQLGVLEYPMHGKPSNIEVLGGRLFEGLPRTFVAGRYHSLFARRETLPPELEVTAQAAGGVVMALEHTTLPIAAVQFHPESLLTLRQNTGLTLIERAVTTLTSGRST
jgi:anthranilate synthase